MAFANSSITDLIATGIEARNTTVANNVLNHNPITANLKKKGRVKTFSGGHKIIEQISFAENPNAGSYSGYDTLPTAPADVISAAEYNIKQYAVPVTVSGLETLQNAGKEGLIDLVEERIQVAEDTMANLLETDVYGDGTGNGGKALTGLELLVEPTATASQTQTVGGIPRATYAVWRNYCATGQDTSTAAKIQGVWNTAWANLTRGADAPDIIIAGAQEWGRYLASLQALQRFTAPDSATLGFPSVKFFTADVYLGGGIGGVVDTAEVLFLNTKFLKWRPHSARNMVSLDPTKRWSTNQDAYVQILAWAGNLTCNGAKFQGRTVTTT